MGPASRELGASRCYRPGKGVKFGLEGSVGHFIEKMDSTWIPREGRAGCGKMDAAASSIPGGRTSFFTVLDTRGCTFKG